MCGISGFSGSYGRDLLGEMNRMLAHRGPDDGGDLLLEHGSSRVGLSHRRLSIIDLSSAAHEPMGVECTLCAVSSAADPVRGRWLVYNGEIYNYRELRGDLEARGHQFISKSDTEVILHLYAEEGTDMLAHLNGMFAFVLYDGAGSTRGRRIKPGSLLVARDGLGVKPLYFAETATGFVFASEMKAVLLAPDVSRDLDLIAVHEYLAFLWSAAPRTPFSSIRKLPPGEALIVSDGRIESSWTYYDLPYGEEPLTGTEDDIAMQVRLAFERAVRRQLVADVSVGAFLSGGLDSSSVVAMMRREHPDRRIPCYSIGFRDQSSADPGSPSDLPYARQVASHLGVDLRTIELEPNMIDRLEEMIWHLDEPQGDPAPINSMIIAEVARGDGIKVLMSGAGGDDIFSGYRRHLAQRHEPLWAWLPRRARRRLAAMVRSLSIVEGAPKGWARSSLARRFSKAFSHAGLDGDARLASYFLWSAEELRRGLYSEGFTAAVASHDTLAPLLQSLTSIPREHDRLNRLLYLETKHFLADHNLNYTDKTTMAAGVETRVPFLDPELVALAARVPSRLKLRGTIGKSIFKKAMEPFLPREVIYRAKSGFGAPIRRWIGVELRPRVDDLLAPHAVRRRGLFDARAVQQLLQNDRDGKVDGSYTIFSLLCIEVWCRLFLDQPRGYSATASASCLVSSQGHLAPRP